MAQMAQCSNYWKKLKLTLKELIGDKLTKSSGFINETGNLICRAMTHYAFVSEKSRSLVTSLYFI